MGRQALDYLFELLRERAEPLAGVSRRKMFGCEALFRDGVIFALIWKEGRIGLKLTDAASFEEMLALPGADRWTIGEKAMSHWTLVPESFHDDEESLDAWVRRAWENAGAPPPKKPKPRKAAAPRQAKAAGSGRGGRLRS